ncbi:MAG: radical SAM protein [bacterium]|nr:radical SAM protein [bacterium]
MKKHPLIGILIEVTQNCNLRCLYCFLETYEGTLEFTRIIKLLDEAANIGIFSLKLSGGEPFMRGDILDIIEEARRRSFAVQIGTNGTLITDAIAKKLANLNVHKVALTIYGVSADTYVQFTGVDAFSKAMDGVHNLSRNGIRTVVKFPITKINYHEVPKVPAMFTGMPNVKLIFSALISGRRNHNMSPIKYQLPTSDIYQIVQKSNIKLEEDITNINVKNISQSTVGISCGAGISCCTITSDGRVLPCPIFPLEAGNIYKKSLKEILDCSPVLLKLRNTTISDMVDCHSCKYLRFCVRCPAMSYLEKKDYCKASDNLCKFIYEWRALKEGTMHAHY